MSDDDEQNDAKLTWTRLEYLRMDRCFIERVLEVKREEQRRKIVSQQNQMKKARANDG
jgi:hypothetical protein